MEGPKDMNDDLDGETMVLTQSGWAFVGSGEIAQLQVIAPAGNTATAKLYDTDELTRSLHQLVDQLTAAAGTSAYSQHDGVPVKRGCYVELSGTDAMALVRIGKTDEFGWADDLGMEPAAEPADDTPDAAAA